MAAEITFDFDRRTRIGIAEAVLCAGKTPAQIAQAIFLSRERGLSLLLTRLDEDAFAALAPADRGLLDYDPASRTAILGPCAGPEKEKEKGVALVAAGTSDLGVAHEARRTLEFHGIASAPFFDVGVAGLWRLLAHEAELRRFPVVIAVAGMEGALFSVLGGLVGGLVIAVPTSTGYGMARGGETALHAALVSCAPGIVVVNIDNGYGAACAAIRALGPAPAAPAKPPPAAVAQPS